MARAASFYEAKLGLPAGEDRSDESRTCPCAGDTSLHVYTSAVHAGTATATPATWYVDDVEEVVVNLAANGVTFERYADPR